MTSQQSISIPGGGAYGRSAEAAVRNPVLALPAAIKIRTALADQPELRSLFGRSEEHTSELQSLMRISYAVFCLKKKNKKNKMRNNDIQEEYVKRTSSVSICDTQTKNTQNIRRHIKEKSKHAT